MRTRAHHISIGRADAGTTGILFIADLDIKVVATATGELLPHLTLDPHAAAKPAKNGKNRNPLQVRSLPMSRDITPVHLAGLCSNLDLAR